MTMKISNYKGVADTFTFVYNPISYDDTSDSNHVITKIGYQKHHILVSGGGIEPKNIILTGHFSGTSKRTYYKSLAKHFQQTTKLKKLYFHSDRFALGIGKQCKETNSGGRTNFIDYVATFESIVGILLDDTEASTGTNEGDVETYVTEITGTVTNGASDVAIGDGYGTILTVPASVLTTNDNFLYKFIEMVNSGSGIYVSEYSWVGLGVDSGTTSSTTATKLVQTGQNFLTTVEANDIVHNTTDSTYATVTNVDNDTTLSLSDDIMTSGETYIIYRQIKSVKITGGYLLMLDSGANITTVTTSNLSSVTKKFRNGWSS